MWLVVGQIQSFASVPAFLCSKLNFEDGSTHTWSHLLGPHRLHFLKMVVRWDILVSRVRLMLVAGLVFTSRPYDF